MSDFDLIIRGGCALLPEGEQMLDLGIRDGRIAELAPAVFGSTDADLDATGFHLLPGGVDSCVRLGHGMEGAWALAAGGVTTYLQAPMGGGVRDRASFEARRAAGEAESLVDFALWGALTADNLAEMEDLAECGVIGFHADLSGPDVIDDGALLEAMRRARELKAIVSIQAENGSIIARLAREAAAAGRLGMRDYLSSRPVIAELEAVQRAILLAWETDCAVHFPQVSTGRAVELIAAARAQGLNVSCSTSPHYLLLTDDDAERLGELARCAPPLRPWADAAALWAQMAAGEVDFITSGHAPAAVGIPAGQSTLGLMLAEACGTQRPFPLSRLSELLATSPARRFRLHPKKGELRVGADADLLIVDLHEQAPLQAETLFHQPPGHTPYLGRNVQGRVLRTILRGRTVFREGKIIGSPGGQFVEAVAADSGGLVDEEPVAHLAQDEHVADHERNGQADIVQRTDLAKAQHDEPQQRG